MRLHFAELRLALLRLVKDAVKSEVSFLAHIIHLLDGFVQRWNLTSLQVRLNLRQVSFSFRVDLTDLSLLFMVQLFHVSVVVTDWGVEQATLHVLVGTWLRGLARRLCSIQEMLNICAVFIT